MLFRRLRFSSFRRRPLPYRSTPILPFVSQKINRQRNFFMDAIISQPSPDKIKVLPHRVYNTAETLSPTTMLPSPLDQFHVWFTEAVKDDSVYEAEAMSLSTATVSGIPSARTVLLKQLDSRGFVFFTNYTSRKSQELVENPHAALVFYWREVHKSVRVIGRVEKVSKEESEAYFKSRPADSRLGAWASKQSSVVGEGEVHARLEKLEQRFGVNAGDKDFDIPFPEFWGGWRVVPDEMEFWCGKPSRLHDRIRYLRIEGSPDDQPEWKIDRLAP